MFTTTLTKRDWFRIYKYLWKTGCIHKYLRYSLITWFTFMDILLLIYFFIPLITLFFLRAHYTIPIFVIIMVPVLLIYQVGLFVYLFYRKTTFFSPETYIVFQENPPAKIVNQVKKHDPTVFISLYGIFTPPKNTIRTLLIFKDYYLIFNSNSKIKYTIKKHNIAVIKRTEITDEVKFLTRLFTIYPKRIDLSNKYLHLE